MEKVILKSEIRETTGKEYANKLRKEGRVPSVVYHKGEDTIPLIVDAKELHHVLHTSAGENVIITLQFTDQVKKEKDKTVVVKEVQHDPVKDDVLHIDFNEISLTETLTVNVPVKTKGEAAGVKEEEGILEHILWELEVECLPTEIPENIEIDVSELRIGDSVQAKDLTIPAGVKLLTDPEQMVVSCVPPKIEEEVPEEELAEGEAAEPEVITERKPEGEDAPAEEGAKKEAPAKEVKPKE